uniref:Uncharacterized protein n=1 Tax=Arundo donax TaxID=35708 RepID=A0A0A9C092_ARUDO
MTMGINKVFGAVDWSHALMMSRLEM